MQASMGTPMTGTVGLLRRLVWLCAAAGLGLPAVAQADASTPTQRYERGGVAIDFSLVPIEGALRAGSNALATFRVSDARTGLPLSGVRPRAWMAHRPSEMLATESECTDKVRTLSGGLLSSRADVDLNSYRVLTLNHDKTISVINPLVAFGATKLENLVVLPANGADWLLTKNQRHILVSLPDADAVAVIDAATRKIAATLSTGAGSRPHRLALDASGRVWVGLDGAAEVLVIDPVSATLLARIGAGRGLHSLAFSTDARYAFVANSADNTVTVIDAARLEGVADVVVGTTPVALAYGAASRQLYVASLNDDTITVIDADSPNSTRRIAVGRGVVALGFEPQGRFAIAVDQLGSRVVVIDSANDSVVGHSAVVKEPDQVAFTERYAYVHAIGSEKFSLLDLAELRNGKLAPLDIQAGRQAPANEPETIGAAAMIAPTPEGNAVMIANAPDRTLYFYQEGMMAPMGTFSNYGRMPRGVLVLDHSLREVAVGVYSTPVRLTKAGRFDVPVVLDQPRHLTCFSIAVEPDAAAPAESPNVAVTARRVDASTATVARQRATLRFRVSEPATGAAVPGLRDAQALVFEPPGIWQRHVPLKDLGEGHYELDLVFPRQGLFNVMLAIPSRGVRFSDLTPNVVRVVAAPGANAATITLKDEP
jgi:YVTN family beta-propeller protein